MSKQNKVSLRIKHTESSLSCMSARGRPLPDGDRQHATRSRRSARCQPRGSSQSTTVIRGIVAGRLFIGAKAEHLSAVEVRALDLLTTVFTERGICNGETVTRETV